MGNLQTRRETYSRISTALAFLDDRELRATVGATSGGRHGWGPSQAAEISGSSVFVKRLALTDLERANMFSTRNRFRLPSYYNYGVGSAGFGVFRELASHVKTTNWVLEGAIESFPLLYHARVMTRRPPQSSDPRFDLDDYVRHWNSSRAVANYMQARRHASDEVWLVLEHFPYTLPRWLPANQGAVGQVIEQLSRTIAFLRSRGIVHFDAHLGNMVSDGRQVFLTDFGLVLDGQFDLTDHERAFLAKHSHYDYGEAIASIGGLLLGMVHGLGPEERQRVAHKYGLEPGAAPDRVLETLLGRLDGIHRDGDLPLEAEYVEALNTHRDVIVFMSTFLTELRRDPRKRSRYDDVALTQLLDAAGVSS